MTGDPQRQYIDTAGVKVNADPIGERSGQCGWEYPGAAGRCPNDSEYLTSIIQRGGPEPVPLCRKHAMEATVDDRR